MNAWRTGGTQGLTPSELDAKLDMMAAQITPQAGQELSFLTLKCLQKDVTRALPLFFDLLRQPRFDPERLQVIKKNKITAIQRRNESSLEIASREFLQGLYGPDSPYAWQYTEQTIAPIDTKMLLDFHARHVAPRQLIIASTSPDPADEFWSRIKPHVAEWNHNVPDAVPPKPIEKEWTPGWAVVQKDDSQSAIVMGHFGEKRFNPDKYKIILANEILGGSTFGSRLGKRLRTELGLVYSLGSSFGLGTDYESFRISTRTNAAKTLTVVNEIKNIVTEMVNRHDITDGELAAAKERILNRLVFDFEQPFKIVTGRVLYDHYGYPPNYVALYQKKIEEVTLSEINAVLGTYFFPDRFRVMIVGDLARMPDLNDKESVVEIPLDWE
ncbi:MAG: peptidase M16 protein [uncultured bacterium]|nr:MAG: peptidase M16 protein [uncultured bacterium]